MVYVILPIHNRLEQTKKFIKCLKNQSHQEIMLIVVDCGSTDKSKEWIENNYKNVYVVVECYDTYWAGALRRSRDIIKWIGIKSGDIAVIMNNDSTFDRDFIRNGVKNTNKNRLLIAEAYDNHTQFDGTVEADWSKLRFSISNNPNICSTRGLFMDAEDFIFRSELSKLLPHYCSDYAMTYKLYRSGFEITSRPFVRLSADMTTTGIVDPQNLKELFSILCPDNPIYKTIFILQCCPMKYWLINIARTWARVIRIRRKK